jgi:pimeloyl-ACP methyl ester carboxylesterase
MTNRAALVIFGLLFLLSCFSLDSYLFEPTKVDEYLRPTDMDPAWHFRDTIPHTLIQSVELESQGKKIYGFLVKPDGLPEHSFENQVTILYCHGKGENINRYWRRVQLLWEMRYKVFIFDYQGYGKSEGTPSAASCYSDGEVVLDSIRSRSDVDTTKIIYYGWSLGSFIATYLAAGVRHPPALILEAPLASVSAVTKEGTVLNFPGSYVVNADFDNEKRITKVDAPILILYGKNDETAVPERHAKVLIDILDKNGKTYQVKVADANHDDIPDVMGNEYSQTITDFIAQYVQ